LFQWVQRGADIDGEDAFDVSGASVSLSSDGNVIAIGAPGNDENGYYSGHVRVYSFESSSWVQKGADIDSEDAGDASGRSVSLSSDGNVVAIGARFNDGNGYYSGHVRVYSFESSSWIQRGADIDGEADFDASGESVSLSSDGNVIAIGAPGNDGNGPGSGHVRVYSFESSSWIQKGADIDGEADFDASGFSVSLSSDGNVVAIGAPRNDGNGTDSGHVRVYSFESSSWVQKGADIDGEADFDASGNRGSLLSVSLSSDGNVVAIGAGLNDGNGTDSGHVRVYSFQSSSWIQRGADIDGEDANDFSGFSVSLSSDGNVVAIGGPFNDGNGTDSGHVRVYAFESSSWVQRGADFDGEDAIDISGFSVSLSSDGNVVAIGAPRNDGNGTDSGHVRVYSFPKSTKGGKGLKAKSTKSRKDGKGPKSTKSKKSKKNRRNVLSLANNDKEGVKAKEGGSSGGGTLVEFVILEEGMN
jgi:uncharacterized protein YaiE (UPF0345 family)